MKISFTIPSNYRLKCTYITSSVKPLPRLPYRRAGASPIPSTGMAKHCSTRRNVPIATPPRSNAAHTTTCRSYRTKRYIRTRICCSTTWGTGLPMTVPDFQASGNGMAHRAVMGHWIVQNRYGAGIFPARRQGAFADGSDSLAWRRRAIFKKLRARTFPKKTGTR